MRSDLDTIDANVLIASLIRRRQQSVGSMIALLELMTMTAGNFSMKEKYAIGNLLRDKADIIERPASNQGAP
jgi:hypothetical protein